MWQLDENKAVFQTPAFAIEIDTHSPESGAVLRPMAGDAYQNASLLRIHSSLSAEVGVPACESVHQRGPDLVVDYRMSKVPEFTWQVYWRALTGLDSRNVLGGIELILSVQTELLDSDPRMIVESHLSNSRVLRVDGGHASAEAIEIDVSDISSSVKLNPPGILLCRPCEASFSYLELVHPSDFIDLEIMRASQDSSEYASRFTMFEAPLEKGVIRRGRLRGLLLSRDDDVASARSCYEQFTASPIPLTA
ncbi:MAG: hypothetical protein EA424_24270 [Planctomycetaceae bacterium]|nr:MAG: hypothetical protein EA424_24270 [Planctomycetaceae bacterium]